ncbi:MAG: hypothetical protein D4R79_13380 [Comamonadaceae bacterium]|nr:MAG: hypothetical protein D4R79_13380 [Comamonadaceae bacterium]
MKIREGQYETKQATWHDLIRWARSKDYQIAPELETLVAKMEPATVNGTAKVTGDSDLCAVFRELKNLDVSEFSIAFVGDKEESGTGINNMLEISAREVTRRIPLASLELVNRHKASGGLNAVGLILLAMTKNKVIGKTDENEKSVSRFRAIIKKKLGIVGNPFEPYRQGVGWAPLFKLADKRGAADARAKHDAERRTQSLDELKENGIEFSDASSENAVDPADEWMKRSGNSWAGGADAE